jgi:hypothetical protein
MQLVLDPCREWCQASPLRDLLTGVVSCVSLQDMTVDAAAGGGWVPDATTFGARLALIRQRMEWGNVKEAALACGLPVESWRNWERDGRQPRDYMRVCQAVAEHTGVDVTWLAVGPQTGLPRKDSNLQPAGNGTLAGIFDWSVPSWHDALGLAA